MRTEIYRHTMAHAPQFAPRDYQHFRIEPLTGALGAEIIGPIVTDLIDDQGFVDELKTALDQHLVLMFRNQNLDAEALRRFGSLFGPLQVNPVVKKQGDAGDVMFVRQEVDEKYNFAGNWHSDVTWDKQPSGETALYAMEVPRCGGDTHFANTALAFEALPDDLKQKLLDLRAVHALQRSQREFAQKKQNDADMTAEQAASMTAIHPVVRAHPTTGCRSLFVNEQFTTNFVGETEEQSRSLLESLWHHQTAPDFTCRIRWQAGTLAIWDNRRTIHYASNDYPNIRRIMMRVSTVGEAPLKAT